MKNNNKLVSSTRLFFLIKITTYCYFMVLILFSYLFPVNLGEPVIDSNVGHTIKAVWYLIWIQELISHSLSLIYIVYIILFCLFLLPFFSKTEIKNATWFCRELRLIHIIVGFGVICLFVLSIIGMFFRGENWEFIF